MDKTMWIRIKEATKDSTEMADLLREVARLLDEGYTSGYYPTWEIESDE